MNVMNHSEQTSAKTWDKPSGTMRTCTSVQGDDGGGGGGEEVKVMMEVVVVVVKR